MTKSETWKRPSIGLLVVAWFVAASCATGGGSRRPSYDIPEGSKTATAFEKWFEGGAASSARGLVPDGVDVDVERLFASAEMAYWSGDVESAFERYLAMLRSRPSHPLNRYAAARAYDLRDDVAAYRERIAPVLEDVKFSNVVPLARVYLSLAGQTVAYRRWNNSKREQPFRADGLGFPTAWRTTPRLSPWQRLDFDHTFSVEEQEHFREKYLSPRFARDRPVNRERIRPYLSGGLSLSPSLGRNGIYYLETFATVEPREGGKGRSYWLYGDFAGAARVWIDGTLVLEREMGRYGTGDRLRRVRLEPGPHRVLVKLGYESGTRDWFDLGFLADTGRALGGSGLSFSMEPPEELERGAASVEPGDEQHEPASLEPAFVRPEKVDGASDTALYLTVLAAYYDQQPRYFDPAWRELIERHPEFAAAHGLKAEQVQTLWELPGDKRRARAISHLREAREHDEESLSYQLRLARMLRNRDRDSDEVRELLESAREGAVASPEEGESPGSARLRNGEALEAWASYLDGRGWTERAEQAWRRAVEADPTNCRAARSLQDRYAARSYYPPLAEITPRWKLCPLLERRRVFERPDRPKRRLAYRRRDASRYPYGVSDQLNFATELRKQGRADRALEVLERARDRMPWEEGIWRKLAEIRLAREGTDAAVETLRRAIEAQGSSPSLLRQIARLRNEVPLADLLRDGRRAALDHLEELSNASKAHPAANSSDEAYYLIDYAVRQYEPNGTSRTLTHTLVRVMTKGAIDRFGEKSVPRGARLLRARTINEDGSVQVPERSSGKSTLSMPGLDEGDFVEMAYIEYGSPSPKAESHIEGLRFYFRMSDISSLHSEYAIIGARDGKFMLHNDPPKKRPYRAEGYEGVHFVREESPRPRKEPYATNGTEYLPWIRLYRNGLRIPPFDADRRYVTDRVLSSLEVSNELEKRVETWREETDEGSREEIRDLFYRVTHWVKNPNPDNFGRDASHTLVSKRGSPHLLLQAAYRVAGIDSELYLVKSEYQHPEEFPIGEFTKYESPVLRVETPDGEAVWLDPAQPDAMFNAVNLSTMGQPAVCVTCEELVERRVPEEGFRRTDREVDVEASLDTGGRLAGRAQVTLHGIRAASVRSSLRRTPEESERVKFFNRVVNGLLPGSRLTDYRIEDEEAEDRPLRIRLEFERPNFGRTSSGGTMRVQTALFQEPIASRYAQLRKRVRPMLIPRQRETNYTLSIDLPGGAEPKLESRKGSWELDSKWGSFERSVELADGSLSVTSNLELPIQRVPTDEYPKFQRWAFGVQRSSRLLLTLER